MGNSSASTNFTSIGISANSTKYFYLKDNFYFTLNGGINYERGISKNFPSFSVNYFGVSIGPGFDFFMTPSFALSSKINILSYQLIRSNDTEANFNRIEERLLFQIKSYCENDLGHTEETIEKQCLVPLKKAQAIKVCNSQGIY